MPTKREQFVQTLRAQYLGERMRQLREERGTTLKFIAGFLGVEFSTLARYERAEWPFRHDHVKQLMDVYGVLDEREREELLALARNAWRANFWEQAEGRNSYTAAVDDRVFIEHQWVIDRAEELRVFECGLVPPLLRTRDYADAVLRHVEGPSSSGQKVERLVRLLAERQQVLDAKPPTRLSVILDEAVLRRPVGSRQVLRAQLEHLTMAVQRPHVNVLVLPARTGWHPGVYGPFTYCQQQRPYPPVVLLEHHGGRMIVESGLAERYGEAYDKIAEHVLPPTESMQLISTLAERLEAGGDIWEPVLAVAA
jgi:transcriptional regulator with XRE-family HTH domain